jgi:hypothetical protein
LPVIINEGIHMKYIIAFLMLLLCAPTLAASHEASGVEATTAITLPVDSVTIYPDGLMAVKRMGSLDVTEGTHKFVVNVPQRADTSSLLLKVSNATIDGVVYDVNPVYTLNVSSAGLQDFFLGYLMYNAATWEPRYDLHLADDSVLVKAEARVSNRGSEDLKNVRLKLVAGLSPIVQPYLAKAAPQMTERFAAAEPAAEAMDMAYMPASSTGELETLYIFELEGRKDLLMNKQVGLPLFQEDAPLLRVYTWDAYNQPEGPAEEEIRVNNTQVSPWPMGRAMLYRSDEYVSTIEMPYTPAGTNASIVVGPSADLKVESKLSNYNITENIKVIGSTAGNRTVKETIENWTYSLEIKSNLDREAAIEVKDTIPQRAVLVSISPEPAERTATSLKWKLQLLPRQETAINYTYQVTTTEGLDSAY